MSQEMFALHFSSTKFRGSCPDTRPSCSKSPLASGERDGVEHPVIVVPDVVRVPVAAKPDLMNASRKTLIRLGDVDFRTLASNGTVSTAAARPSDWRDIMEICFDNRKADIGRFLRRHLGDRDIGACTVLDVDRAKTTTYAAGSR